MKIRITERQYKNLIERDSQNSKSENNDNFFVTALSKIISSHKFVLPIHLRAFANFLIGRTSPFTEKDMTEEEKDFLKKAALSVGEEGFNYRFWMKDKSSLENKFSKNIVQLINMDLPDQFNNFLGGVSRSNIKVQPGTNNVTIIDNYDMNTRDWGRSKEELMKELDEAFKAFIKTPSKETYYLIRSLASLRELGGYNGFPVYIKL